MHQVESIRSATVAVLGVLLVLWGAARAEPELKVGAAETLEVQVLEAQAPLAQGDAYEVRYRMEVLSVLGSSPSRVKPGDIIAVRSYGSSTETLAPGWIGVAHLNADPKASGAETHQRFIAADSDGFEENPPGPPALRYRYIPRVEGGAQ